MWLITPDGFYSIVEPTTHDKLFQRHGKPGDLVVRARAGSDLTNLRKRWLPELGKTITTPVNRDYGYRAFVDRDALARAVARITLAIDYSNFKDEVHDRLGHQRAGILHRVWNVLTDIQYGPRRPSRWSAFGPVDRDLDELEDDWSPLDHLDPDIDDDLDLHDLMARYGGGPLIADA